MFTIPRASRDWRLNAGLGLLASVLGVLFLLRPELALAVVAGTLGFSGLVTGATLLRTAWEQRDAELAYDHAARRVRVVPEPAPHQQFYAAPGGRTWVRFR